MNKFKEFWDSQTTSLHRADLPNIYFLKASEHIGLMSSVEKDLPVLDIGCGAGELLEHYVGKIRVVAAIDFSNSMLDQARKRLHDTSIKISNSDIFEYLPEASESIWLATGSVNQYLKPFDVRNLLAIFSRNQRAKTFFLFDCIDPLRYAIWPFGSSFRKGLKLGKNPEIKKLIRSSIHFYRRLTTATKFGLGFYSRPCVSLGGSSMGYGYLPSQWRTWADELVINCELVNSAYYEYRYHVILRKSD